MIAAIEAHGQLGYLSPVADVPPQLADVVQLDPEAITALRSLFGASKLRDRAPEIALAQQRLAFASRTPLADLTLPPGSTLISIVVEIAEIRGTIGATKRDPTAGPDKVTITHGRRPIIDVDPTPPTAWLGVIDGDAFGEESDFEGLTDRARERITEIFASHRPIVVSALCAAGFADGDADLGRRWVGELDDLGNITVWIHRTTIEPVDGVPSAPGPGGRCVDWADGTGTLADGEWAELTADGIVFNLDSETFYDGLDSSHTDPIAFPCMGSRARSCAVIFFVDVEAPC